MRFSNS